MGSIGLSSNEIAGSRPIWRQPLQYPFAAQALALGQVTATRPSLAKKAALGMDKMLSPVVDPDAQVELFCKKIYAAIRQGLTVTYSNSKMGSFDVVDVTGHEGNRRLVILREADAEDARKPGPPIKLIPAIFQQISFAQRSASLHPVPNPVKKPATRRWRHHPDSHPRLPSNLDLPLLETDIAGWTPAYMKKWIELRGEKLLPLKPGGEDGGALWQRLKLIAEMQHSPLLSHSGRGYYYEDNWAEGSSAPTGEDLELALERLSAELGKAPPIFLRTGWTPRELKAWLIPQLPRLPRHERMVAFRQISGKSRGTVARKLGITSDNLRRIEEGTHAMGFKDPSKWSAYAEEVGCEDVYLILAGMPEEQALDSPSNPRDWFEWVRLDEGKTLPEVQELLAVGNRTAWKWSRQGLPAPFTPRIVLDILRNKLDPEAVRAFIDQDRDEHWRHPNAFGLLRMIFQNMPGIIRNPAALTLNSLQRLDGFGIDTLRRSSRWLVRNEYLRAERVPPNNPRGQLNFSPTQKAANWWEARSNLAHGA